MSGLSEQEVAAIDGGLEDTGCHGFLGDHPELYAAVEQIVARHVAVALTEVAEQIASALPTWHRGMYGCPDDMFARRDLVRIVRAAIPPP